MPAQRPLLRLPGPPESTARQGSSTVQGTGHHQPTILSPAECSLVMNKLGHPAELCPER
jgi:hypothetical protein